MLSVSGFVNIHPVRTSKFLWHDFFLDKITCFSHHLCHSYALLLQTPKTEARYVVGRNPSLVLDLLPEGCACVWISLLAPLLQLFVLQLRLF